MKPILAVIGGFALSFGMFVAGIVFALFVMTGEPPQMPNAAVNMAEVWSSEPRTVNTKAQAFERLPPIKQGAHGGSESAVDTMTTAAVPSAGEEPQAGEPADDPAAARLFTAHAEWCSGRYRSYDASTNSYSPYKGGRRQCISPYAAEYAALTGAAPPPDSHERFVPVARGWSSSESFSSNRNAPSLEYVIDDRGADTGLVIDRSGR